MAIDFGLLAQDNPRAITYVSLVAMGGVLTVGMVWSQVRRELSGQVDVDDVDGL